MTAALLFFYVVGDVLGSGISALIGLVAGQVGGAFWTAFALGVGVALITGLAYAALVTRYPVAAGAALHIAKAFRNDFFTFMVTFCMLAAVITASGALALTFGGVYFQEFPGLADPVGGVPALHLRSRDHRLPRLRRDEGDRASFRAPTPLLYVGVLGNAGLLAYTVVDDPGLLLYCGGLLAVGLLLWVAQHLHGRRTLPRAAG